MLIVRFSIQSDVVLYFRNIVKKKCVYLYYHFYIPNVYYYDHHPYQHRRKIDNIIAMYILNSNEQL